MGRKSKRQTAAERLHKAAKEAGFTPEQIAAFATEEDLQNAINRIKPSILASAGKIAAPKKKKEPVETEIKTVDFVLTLSPMTAKTPLRAQNEQQEIDAYLNRRGLRPAVTRIQVDRSFSPQDDNKYLTKVTISYRGPK
jgi:hypothetical protein